MQSDVTQVQILNLMAVFAPSDYYRYALCASGTEAEHIVAKMELCLAPEAAACQSTGVEDHSNHICGLCHAGQLKLIFCGVVLKKSFSCKLKCQAIRSKECVIVMMMMCVCVCVGEGPGVDILLVTLLLGGLLGSIHISCSAVKAPVEKILASHFSFYSSHIFPFHQTKAYILIKDRKGIPLD